jgi:hypothetical protein
MAFLLFVFAPAVSLAQEESEPTLELPPDSPETPVFPIAPPDVSAAEEIAEPPSPPSPGYRPPSLPSSSPGDVASPAAPADSAGILNPISVEATEIEIRYAVEKPVIETFIENGKPTQVTRYVREERVAKIDVNANLDELDLPVDGKRAAVLAITAARHEGLLQKLKGAEGDEEKTAAAEALKANYTEHYAIETWWREQRLADLEKRLEELRAQVKQRQEAQEKYIDAAMTIAELWADGIAIAPPKPSPPADRAPATTYPPPSSNAYPAYGTTAPASAPSLGPPSTTSPSTTWRSY